MDGYTVTEIIHVNDVDRVSGKIVPGRQVTVSDTETGQRVEVFVPDSVWSTQNVEAMIEEELLVEREVWALGDTPPAA